MPELPGGQHNPGEQHRPVHELPPGGAQQIRQRGGGQRRVAAVAGCRGGGYDGEHGGCERYGEWDPGASGAAELEQFRGDQ